MNIIMMALLLVSCQSIPSFSDWQKVDASSHVSYRPFCSQPEFWICDWVDMMTENKTKPEPILPEIHL